MGWQEQWLQKTAQLLQVRAPAIWDDFAQEIAADLFRCYGNFAPEYAIRRYCHADR